MFREYSQGSSHQVRKFERVRYISIAFSYHLGYLNVMQSFETTKSALLFIIGKYTFASTLDSTISFKDIKGIQNGFILVFFLI